MTDFESDMVRPSPLCGGGFLERFFVKDSAAFDDWRFSSPHLELLVDLRVFGVSRECPGWKDVKLIGVRLI